MLSNVQLLRACLKSVCVCVGVCSEDTLFRQDSRETNRTKIILEFPPILRHAFRLRNCNNDKMTLQLIRNLFGSAGFAEERPALDLYEGLHVDVSKLARLRDSLGITCKVSSKAVRVQASGMALFYQQELLQQVLSAFVFGQIISGCHSET